MSKNELCYKCEHWVIDNYAVCRFCQGGNKYDAIIKCKADEEHTRYAKLIKKAFE